MATDFDRYASLVEKEVTRKLLSLIFSKAGRSVAVDDGEESTGLIFNEAAVYQHLASTGENWIEIYDNGEKLGAVWLVWGNGVDLISDYSNSLESWIDPLLEEIEGLF